MSYFFTDNFKTALVANQALMEGQSFKLALFRFAPGLEAINPAWRAAKTVAELVATPGWVEVTGITGYPLTNTMPTATRVIGGSRYVMYNPYSFAALSGPTEVRAIGVVATGAAIGGTSNALIMVTTSPIDGVLNLSPTDALTSAPDSTFPDATNRWMFSWSVATPDPVEGVLVIAKGSPPFEVSGSQHTWLYPQRANMISNPSFEATGVNYWSGNAAITRIAGAAPGSIGGWSGQIAASESYVTLLGQTTAYISTPDSALLSTTGDLDIQVDIAPDDWTPAAYQVLISKDNNVGGQRSWGMYLQTNGALVVYWSQNGTNVGTFSSTAVLSALPDGTRRFVRATIDTSNGTSYVASFYTSTDGGVTWTALGTPVSSPGVLNVLDTIAPVRIGVYGTTPLNPFKGKIYSARVYDGIGGTPIASPDFTNMGMTTTSVVDAQGSTWTFNGTASATGNLVQTVVMESNVWSTQMGEKFNEDWSVQVMAKGTGKLKVGLVYWDASGRSTLVDWGQNESWDLATSSWTHVAVHRHIPSAHLAMLRLEVWGNNLIIDQVLAEPGYLKDWLYFDGDERYGARDDFCWYGGYNRQGKSYSLWYNHRKAVVGRLFARNIDPNDPTQNATDEDMEEQGLVYRWVPAGITVVPHMDVFYPFDPQNPVPTKAAGILPYYNATTAPTGVPSPWV